MNIYMDSFETKKVGSEITESIDYLKRNIALLYQYVDEVANNWQSNEATEYINILKEKNLPELEKLCSVLESYNSFINNVPTIYETLDEVFTSKGIDF